MYSKCKSKMEWDRDKDRALKGAISSDAIKYACQHMNTMNILTAGYNLINDVTYKRGQFSVREGVGRIPAEPKCQVRVSPFCSDIQRTEIRNQRYLRTFFENQMGVEIQFHSDPKYQTQTLIYDEKSRVLKLMDQRV